MLRVFSEVVREAASDIKRRREHRVLREIEQRQRSVEMEMPRCEVLVEGAESPLAHDPEASAQRRESALALTDDDTYGYVLLLLKKPKGAEAIGEIRTTGYIRPEWWPSFIEMTHRLREVGLQITRT